MPEEEPVAASLLEALLQEAKKQTSLLENMAWATKRQEALLQKVEAHQRNAL